jgi:hypothetical protein
VVPVNRTASRISSLASELVVPALPPSLPEVAMADEPGTLAERPDVKMEEDQVRHC